jgi:hypothetical protein
MTNPLLQRTDRFAAARSDTHTQTDSQPTAFSLSNTKKASNFAELRLPCIWFLIAPPAADYSEKQIIALHQLVMRKFAPAWGGL